MNTSQKTSNDSQILETIQGTAHTHINEVGKFEVTRLVSNVVYQLVINKFFTSWQVSGQDEAGKMHSFHIRLADISSQESRFYGIF